MATFPSSLDTFVSPSSSNKLNSPSHSGIETLQNEALTAIENNYFNYETLGWFPVSDTWTYSSADSPVFVATVPSDATAKYSPGMRVRLTQTTVKYFIVVAVTTTSVSLYGGTDYTLASATISSISISPWKAPLGFPLNPLKWRVELVDSSSRSQTTPTQNTWYNLNSNSLTVPIGSWYLSYHVNLIGDKTSATEMEVYSTLSTGTTTETDKDFTAEVHNVVGGNGANRLWVNASVYRQKNIDISVKTVYYLNVRTVEASAASIQTNGSLSSTIIRAVSAYL